MRRWWRKGIWTFFFDGMQCNVQMPACLPDFCMSSVYFMLFCSLAFYSKGSFVTLWFYYFTACLPLDPPFSFLFIQKEFVQRSVYTFSSVRSNVLWHYCGQLFNKNLKIPNLVTTLCVRARETWRLRSMCKANVYVGRRRGFIYYSSLTVVACY